MTTLQHAQTKVRQLERRVKRTQRTTLNLFEWVQQHRKMLAPGKPLDFATHQYLVKLHQETAGKTVIKKAAQRGISEVAISLALWSCDSGRGNTLYVFPTVTHISDFSSARFNPAIEGSPYLSGIVVSGSESGGVERVQLKRIRSNFLYLRGAQVGPTGNAPGLKSIDASTLILDELDEMPEAAIPIAEKRLLHATDPIAWYISTPSYPGYGIDELYAGSSQNEWLIKCDACGHWTLPTIEQVVTEWDELGRPVAWHGQAEGRAWIACEHCGGELDRLSGQWVAGYPDREIAGYHPTVFCSPWGNLLEIVEGLQTTDESKRKEIYNQNLGECYVPVGVNLTGVTLDACRQDYAPFIPDGDSYAGIDVGNLLNITIRTKDGRQAHYGEVPTFEEIAYLLDRYRVRRAVMDAGPEYHKARGLQASQPKGRVWLCFYNLNDTKDDELCRWDKKKGIVQADRTRAIDRLIDKILNRDGWTLPANARNLPNYYGQMTASVRVVEENTKGIPVARWVHSQPDHALHSEVYCMLAMLAPQYTGHTVTVQRRSYPSQQSTPTPQIPLFFKK
jgi:hypothetical protein